MSDPLTNHQKAENYEALVLTAIHLFGFLDLKNLADLVFNAYSREDSRINQARDVVKRLLGYPPIVKKKKAKGINHKPVAPDITKAKIAAIPNGARSFSYVLTELGARYLRNIYDRRARKGTEIKGVSGRTFGHRCLGTAYLIQQLVNGGATDSWGEYALLQRKKNGLHPYHEFEIAKGLTTLHYPKYEEGPDAGWPEPKEVFLQKAPDGLLQYEAQERIGKEGFCYDWIEVEGSTHKPIDVPRNEDGTLKTTSKKEWSHRKAIEIVFHTGKHLLAGVPHFLDRVVIVFNRNEPHEDKIVRAIELAFKGRRGMTYEQQKLYLSKLRLVRATIKDKSYDVTDFEECKVEMSKGKAYVVALRPATQLSLNV